MKNVIFIGVLLFCVTTSLKIKAENGYTLLLERNRGEFVFAPTLTPPSEIHGGLNYKNIKRGHYDGKIDDFIEDLRHHVENGTETEMFQYQEWVQDFVENVKSISKFKNKKIDLDYILDNAKEGGAPKGFRASKNSSYVMTSWDKNYDNILYGARDAEPGERFMWLDGVCILSLRCANFMQPVGTDEDKPEEDEEEEEEEEPTPYVKVAKKKRKSDADIYINIENTNTNGKSGKTAEYDDQQLQPVYTRNDQYIYNEDSYKPNGLDWAYFGLGVLDRFMYQGNMGNNFDAGQIYYPRSRCFPQRVRRQNNNRCVTPIRRRCNIRNGGGNNGGNNGGGRIFNNDPVNPPGQGIVINNGAGPRRNNSQLSSNVVNLSNASNNGNNRNALQRQNNNNRSSRRSLNRSATL